MNRLAGRFQGAKTLAMADGITRNLTFRTPQATADFAARLAPALCPGDTLLLEGPIGAGKTHFSRALIQARLRAANMMEDVPSPTFTLVQTYDDGKTEIWHSDLYRLTHPDEIEELGLTHAFAEAICLVEWPDRLADLTPENAALLTFLPGAEDDERRLSITYTDAKWSAKIDTASEAPDAG